MLLFRICDKFILYVMHMSCEIRIVFVVFTFIQRATLLNELKVNLEQHKLNLLTMYQSIGE